MGMDSWVHVIYGKKDYEKLLKIEKMAEDVGLFYIGHYVLFEGEVRLKGRLGNSIGGKNKISLLIITHSDGSCNVDKLIDERHIEGEFTIIALSNLHKTELKDASYYTTIRKGTYITQEEFLHHLEKMELESEYNNFSFQEERKLNRLKS